MRAELDLALMYQATVKTILPWMLPLPARSKPAGPRCPPTRSDIAYMARPGAEEIQLDLILDYRSNVALYPAFHAYFREHQPPFLAVWGRHDPAFIPAGAEAYRKDLPNAESASSTPVISPWRRITRK